MLKSNTYPSDDVTKLKVVQASERRLELLSKSEVVWCWGRQKVESTFFSLLSSFFFFFPLGGIMGGRMGAKKIGSRAKRAQRK